MGLGRKLPKEADVTSFHSSLHRLLTSPWDVVADCAEEKYLRGHDSIAVQDLQARLCGCASGDGGGGRLDRERCMSQSY